MNLQHQRILLVLWEDRYCSALTSSFVHVVKVGTISYLLLSPSSLEFSTFSLKRSKLVVALRDSEAANLGLAMWKIRQWPWTNEQGAMRPVVFLFV